MQRVKKHSDLRPFPPYGPTLGNKIIDFVFEAFISFYYCFLKVLNVLGGHRKPYTGSLQNRSNLPPGHPYGSNWDHKITYFVFLSFISFIIAIEIVNVLGGNRKPCIGILQRRSDLLLGPPCGLNWGHKIADFVFWSLSPL